jgi:hypothetical protein
MLSIPGVNCSGLFCEHAQGFRCEPGQGLGGLEVPSCYKHTPPRLQPGYLSKFKQETLFYIFYSMPQVCVVPVALAVAIRLRSSTMLAVHIWVDRARRNCFVMVNNRYGWAGVTAAAGLLGKVQGGDPVLHLLQHAQVCEVPAFLF